LKEWFEFANRFWDFSKHFEGIRNYSTLAEKREDLVLLKKLESLVETHLVKEWENIKKNIKD